MGGGGNSENGGVGRRRGREAGLGWQEAWRRIGVKAGKGRRQVGGDRRCRIHRCTLRGPGRRERTGRGWKVTGRIWG